MDRYARGEDAAFSELYDLLAPRLASFLLRRTRDAARTEDLVQQTFLQMHCARRHFAAGAAVTPWAFAIARRLLIDALRKGTHEHTTGEDGAPAADECAAPDARPDDRVGRSRLVHRMEQELARLPEMQRTAFELVWRDGLSMAEAAEALGTSVTAVKMRTHRTYEALRGSLGDEVREELGGPS
jgi:RNA polymerase sigma-70 factor, ECF subfamily